MLLLYSAFLRLLNLLQDLEKVYNIAGLMPGTRPGERGILNNSKSFDERPRLDIESGGVSRQMITTIHTLEDKILWDLFEHRRQEIPESYEFVWS